MKSAYLGGTRGYQSAIYRPGAGWTGRTGHWRVGRQPRVLGNRRRPVASPLVVAHKRRPGLATKMLILSTIMVVAAALALVLTGTVAL
jgi:hypothetical protein